MKEMYMYGTRAVPMYSTNVVCDVIFFLQYCNNFASQRFARFAAPPFLAKVVIVLQVSAGQ
jgi:hypothetical protein